MSPKADERVRGNPTLLHPGARVGAPWPHAGSRPRERQNPPTFFEDWREVFRNLPVVLTAKQLEPVLGINCKTIWAMALNGILPSYRWRGTVRFNKYGILRWLEAHRNGGGRN